MFQPGQRWVSNTESELGLGIVLRSANRRVELSFPAAGEKRTYATDIAPLSRVRYEAGQVVKNADGRTMKITEIEEHNGCLIYLGHDKNDELMVLPELDLDSFVQFSNPQERLFAGQIDKNSSFRMRCETLKLQRQLQASPVAGLLGARIQLLPHQLYIASEVASRYAPRVLLADEVGLGKTIEAGLILHQQLFTGRAKRVLIAVPDSLLHQWLVEMLRRFNLFFTLMDEERCEALQESGSDNPFESSQLVLCSLSLLSDNPERLDQAVAADWDLLVVDEAHHLEWHQDNSSPAYDAIEKLSIKAKGLLLLTATPEQLGLAGHFARLRLLDPARYADLEAFRKEEERYAPVNQLVQTLLADNGLEQLESAPVKTQLESFLGKTAVADLYQQWTDNEDNTDPQDRLKILIKEILDRHGTGRVLFRNTRASIQGFPERQMHTHELDPPDDWKQTVADTADADILSLLQPERLLGEDWLKTDSRVQWLSDFLKQHRGDKVLVICAQAETALQLELYLSLKQGVHSAVFHEGLSLVARDRAAAYFADEEEGAQVLVCSEIGSEGRNFQFSNQLVLFDLPLNPDLLEQRIGRLDRIGQQHDIDIHVPCYKNSAQQVLLRWYHEGVNAFEHTCAIGQAMYQQFEPALHKCLLNPGKKTAISNLLKQTKSAAETLSTKLRDGRDRLLELNSCDPDKAAHVVEDMHEHQRRQVLSAYMERVFDQFGVDQDHHSVNSIVLHPGEHMEGDSFPGLPDDGLTATFMREVALSREDFQYLTWEHPMVAGAMDMVINGELGNTAFCSIKLPQLRPGMLLLEAIFTVNCTAPASLQLQRYLPLTSIRVVVDSKKNDLSEILTSRHFNKLGKNVRRHTAQDVVRQTRNQIKDMIKQAAALAGKQQTAIVDSASEKMQTMQQSEIQRLKALSEVNPNIRPQEIEYLQAETDELESCLEHAQIKLDALRIAVITE
jgi:ATP-dependent helicase HepA